MANTSAERCEKGAIVSRPKGRRGVGVCGKSVREAKAPAAALNDASMVRRVQVKRRAQFGGANRKRGRVLPSVPR